LVGSDEVDAELHPEHAVAEAGAPTGLLGRAGRHGCGYECVGKNVWRRKGEKKEKIKKKGYLVIFFSIMRSYSAKSDDKISSVLLKKSCL